VSFIGISGVRCGVEVEAEPLYEAAVKAIARFREDRGWNKWGTPPRSPHVASKKVRLKILLMRG